MLTIARRLFSLMLSIRNIPTIIKEKSSPKWNLNVMIWTYQNSREWLHFKTTDARSSLLLRSDQWCERSYKWYCNRLSRSIIEKCLSTLFWKIYPNQRSKSALQKRHKPETLTSMHQDRISLKVPPFHGCKAVQRITYLSQ